MPIKQKAILLILFSILVNNLFAQERNVVLIESFSETGCGFCAKEDSAYNALMRSKYDKVAVINYHCFYKLDTFYQYNKASDHRYLYYKLKGVPAGLINGLYPVKFSSYITFIKSELIDSLYSKPPQINFQVSYSPFSKNNSNGTKIKIKGTALKDIPLDSLSLFVVVTESNINHIERYKKKSVYGINEFDHIMREMLTGKEGKLIGKLEKGKTFSTSLTYTNNDATINFKETQVIVFLQDLTSGEVFGTTVSKHPY
jgi:hypothetical protein